MDDLSEIRDSKFVSALGLKDATAIEIGVGILRIDNNCFSVVRNSPVDIVFGPVGGAPAVVCVGVAGFDLDCLAIIFDCPVELVVSPVNNATIIIISASRGLISIALVKSAMARSWSPLALKELPR